MKTRKLSLLWNWVGLAAGGAILAGGAGCESFVDCDETKTCVDDVDGVGGVGGEPSDESSTGGGPVAEGGAPPVVVEDECSRDADCEAPASEACVARCVEDEEVGAKVCVVEAADADGDDHRSAACEESPGDDCDDADALSFPGAPALVAVGDAPRCGLESGDTCQNRPLSIAWTPAGTPVLATTPTNATVIVRELDSEGVPSGSETSWTLPNGVGDQLRLVPKATSGEFALVWQGLVPSGGAGPSSRVLFLSPHAVLGNNGAVSSTNLGAGTIYSGAQSLDAVSVGEAWNVYAETSYYFDTNYVSNGTNSTTQIAKDFTSVSSRSSVVVGSTRMVVGLDDYSYSNAAYDPRLVVRRYPLSGSITTQIGADITILGNAATDDVGPRVALGRLGSELVLFYRDEATGVPLTARTLTEEGVVSAAVPSESDFVPLDLFATPDLGGGVLIAARLREGLYDVYAQRFDAALAFVGEPALLLEGLATLNGTFRGEGHGVRGSFTFVGGGGGRYRLLRANRCE